jgi:cobalt-zinc-cadmium efflux system membrane fusion protein
MKRSNARLSVLLLGSALFAGCGQQAKDPAAEAPPPTTVENASDANIFAVDQPDKFPLTQAVEHISTSQLVVTATVNPDISRTVPVVSIAAGRVVEIRARLGDTVKKGQVLLKVQSADISGAFSDYQKAVADEKLSHTQLDRAKLLYDKGAISLNDFQVAQDTEDKAEVDVRTSAEKIHVLGNTNLNNPSGVVDIHAPISGVITDQQVTNAAGVQGLASPNPFTISDLSHVWIICDLYENDLPTVHLGDKVEVRLNAYPGMTFAGTVGNVSPVLDPNLRTAKVRIEVKNPGLMRIGMFGTATFHGQKKEKFSAVPATAILHLHDRDWIYEPLGGNKFKRVEVKAGDMLPLGMQLILSGVAPGLRLVANALEFQNTSEQ